MTKIVERAFYIVIMPGFIASVFAAFATAPGLIDNIVWLSLFWIILAVTNSITLRLRSCTSRRWLLLLAVDVVIGVLLLVATTLSYLFVARQG